MNSVSEYLAMGGYAVFVWPAYGLTLFVLLLLLGTSIGNYRAQKRALEERDPEGKRSRS